MKRAEMRTWMRYIEEVPTVAVRVPSFNMAFLPRYTGLDESQFRNKQSDIRPIRKHFYRRMGPAGFDNEDFYAALEQITNTCQRMENAIADGPWLVGNQYTLADIIMAPLIDRMEDLGFAYLWNENYPGMRDWMSRIKLRPAFLKAFPAGCRLSEMHELATPSC
ncbi:MAG: glutathione S-transferase family protein [Desulfobulbia bacterium]